MFVLGIDTCGPSGSVAVGRLNGNAVEVTAQKELAGRTYSAALIPAVEGLFRREGIRLGEIGCIVIVYGPGSFTGVRVGVAAAKGLAEGAGVPVVPVSRLHVLAEKAGTLFAALDAHRHEVFLRTGGSGATPQIRELLAGPEDLAHLGLSSNIAVCDDPAEALLLRVCPSAHLVRASPPTAGDALQIAAPAIADGRFADLALLDGHYLRRSDAEIFGNTVTKP